MHEYAPCSATGIATTGAEPDGGVGAVAVVDARWELFRLSGVLDDSPDPELDRWTTSLRRATGAAVSALCFVEGTRQLVKSVCTVDGTADRGNMLPQSLSLERYATDLACSHGSSDPCVVYAEAPITADGRIVGQACIASCSHRDWGGEDLDALTNTAAAVSTEVALRLARSEAERVHQLVASHNRVHDLIARGAPLREVLEVIVESIRSHDASIKPSVLMFDPTSSTLFGGIGPTLPPEYLAAIDGVVIGPNIGTCGSAAWHRRMVITENIAEDPKWVPIRDFAASADLAHCWSMPILTSDGDALGTLAFYGSRPRRPLPEHVTLMQDWARLAGIAIERSRTLDRLIHDARHDSLTGLPSRRAILERLEEAIQRVAPGGMAAVLFVDLDRLKMLNDTLGHDRADEMLREVSRRLSGAVGDDTFVGRFGGDEFVVVAENIADAEHAGALGLRLLEAISQPLPGVDTVSVTASIGISLVRSSAVDVREVIRESDSAMYDAKRSGRDRCAFFEGGQRVRSGRRLTLARELRGAEMRGEFGLVYQPVFGVSDRRIVGVEALLRWTSPTFGAVSPVEFVPIAEDTGTIVSAGAWVLRESCEAMAHLAERGHPLALNVNVSARQVSHPEFTVWVRKTLAHAEFPADMLCLEITETALMRPDAVTIHNLSELDVLGVRMVLDDFGTGYSSLSWLKQRPFSEIKIDRTFISGLPGNAGDHAIVLAIIGMARGFGCVVTAEGIETEAQMAALDTLGCDRAQGFLLARPMPIEELTSLLTREHTTVSSSSA